MKNLTIKNLIRTIAGTATLITAQHYGSELLVYKRNLIKTQIENERYTSIKEQLEALKTKSDVIINNQENETQARNLLHICKEGFEKLKNDLSSNNVDINSVNKQADVLNKQMQEVIDLFNSSKKNFNLNIDLSWFYDYLNSLTLLEESALLHIFIFIFILLTLFNLISILFVNEIIKYFKLEDKHPYLNKVLTLRLKFQKYYLILNFIILILVCLGALFLNLFILY
jgi:hypothetical protein